MDPRESKMKILSEIEGLMDQLMLDKMTGKGPEAAPEAEKSITVIEGGEAPLEAPEGDMEQSPSICKVCGK